MIALLDYGAGNVGSVLKALGYLGYPAERVDRPELLARAKRLILPGQGHFAAMMGALATRRLVEPLREWLMQGKPYLGICLGLQALYEESEEAPGVAGSLKCLTWGGVSWKFGRARSCSRASPTVALFIIAIPITAQSRMKVPPLQNTAKPSPPRSSPARWRRCSFTPKSRVK